MFHYFSPLLSFLKKETQQIFYILKSIHLYTLSMKRGEKNSFHNQLDAYTKLTYCNRKFWEKTKTSFEILGVIFEINIQCLYAYQKCFWITYFYLCTYFVIWFITLHLYLLTWHFMYKNICKVFNYNVLTLLCKLK